MSKEFKFKWIGHHIAETDVSEQMVVPTVFGNVFMQFNFISMTYVMYVVRYGHNSGEEVTRGDFDGIKDLSTFKPILDAANEEHAIYCMENSFTLDRSATETK